MDSPFHAAIPAHHHPGWALGPDSHSWFVFERQRQHWVQFATPDVAPTHGSFKQVTLAMGLDKVSLSQISPCRGVVPPPKTQPRNLMQWPARFGPHVAHCLGAGVRGASLTVTEHNAMAVRKGL